MIASSSAFMTSRSRSSLAATSYQLRGPLVDLTLSGVARRDGFLGRDGDHLFAGMPQLSAPVRVLVAELLAEGAVVVCQFAAKRSLSIACLRLDELDVLLLPDGREVERPLARPCRRGGAPLHAGELLRLQAEPGSHRLVLAADVGLGPQQLRAALRHHALG